MQDYSPCLQRRARTLAASYALLAFVIPFGSALAQQPTPEQRSAVRAACRADFIAQCSGVTPGGIEALTCLQKHSATLSESCQKAVPAITAPKKATAFSPTEAPAAAVILVASSPTTAQRNAIKSACSSDFMKLCSGVTPGGAEALSCLQKNNSALSGSCQQAVGALSTGSAPAASPPAAGGTTTASPPAAMPSFTPRQEVRIVRETCGGDFRRLCSTVPLGGGRGIACLRENLSHLSAGCQKVLTKGL